MEDLLEKIINNNKDFYKEGRVADYIPALKNANIQDCGLSIIDKAGKRYSVGDYNKNFTMQSISKIVALIQAIIENGAEEVFEKTGYEGSDRSFNNISYLEDANTIKTINPMMNSGAIIVTSLIQGEKDEKFNKILKLTRKLALNEDIGLDEEVYISEKNTGDKNRAIAYLMKAEDIMQGHVDNILDNYFKQCSISLNTIDLANIGFNIANRFENIDLAKNIDKKNLSNLLIAIMNNTGMYNFSGQWAAKVGIPSKSGVAGGILSVLPERYGIGFYGPSLDSRGNPLVGYKVLKELSKELKLSIF